MGNIEGRYSDTDNIFENENAWLDDGQLQVVNVQIGL